MKANYFMNESVNLESATAKAIRYGKTFLVKPAFEASSFMCTDLNFRETLECPRVIRMEDYMNGIEPMSREEAFQLAGNQPVFYFQERAATDVDGEFKGYEWNGFLLFRTSNKAEAREAVSEHAEELNIILAYDNPMDNLYYILIDTKAEKLDEKTLRKMRFKHKSLLIKHIPYVTWTVTDYFARAFTENHYDLVNMDALFGKPEIFEADPSSRSCKPMSVGEILKNFFSHLFKKIA